MLSSLFIQPLSSLCIFLTHGACSMSELCVDAVLAWRPLCSAHGLVFSFDGLDSTFSLGPNVGYSFDFPTALLGQGIWGKEQSELHYFGVQQIETQRNDAIHLEADQKRVNDVKKHHDDLEYNHRDRATELLSVNNQDHAYIGRKDPEASVLSKAIDPNETAGNFIDKSAQLLTSLAELFDPIGMGNGRGKGVHVLCSENCRDFYPSSNFENVTGWFPYGGEEGTVGDSFKECGYAPCVSFLNGDSLIRVRAFLFADNELGFRPSVLREIAILRMISFHRRILHVSLDVENGGAMFVMPFLVDKVSLSSSNMQSAVAHDILFSPSNRKQDVSPLWKKSWLYIYLAAINWFHQKSRPYQRILVPSLLLEGRYVPGLEALLNSPILKEALNLDAASGHCFSGTIEVMCAGDIQPLGNLLYLPPEILLASPAQRSKRNLASDLWFFGCCVHHLYADLFLFPINETQSEFAQLIEIFKMLGTPNPRTWPEVTKLKNYQPDFPQWSENQLGSSLKSCGVEDVVIDFLHGLLVCCPEHRLTAYQAMQHPFFDDLKCAVFAAHPNASMEFSPLPSIYFALEHQNIPRFFGFSSEFAKNSSLSASGNDYSIAPPNNKPGTLSALVSSGIVSRIGNSTSLGHSAANYSSLFALITPETPSPNNLEIGNTCLQGLKSKSLFHREKMRTILVDWLIDVAAEFHLSEDSIFLAACI